MDENLSIEENYKKISRALPSRVNLLAVTKGRGVIQVEAVIRVGAKIIGENYVDEAEEKFRVIGRKAGWHLIGHLQSNKIKKAVPIFDMIETLDSLKLAELLNKECQRNRKIMPVLIEVNSAAEPQKYGLMPDRVADFLEAIRKFNNLKPMGLMTMGPAVDDPEEIRPFFKRTRQIFDRIAVDFPEKDDWIYLSMGMSNTYKIALEEGANIVRIGTAIFGPRQ